MAGKVRIVLAWLLVPPFLFFATPTAVSLGIGSGVALAGLALRAWAAGCIDKDASLATGGPYAHTRNPLYLGSFVVGIGFGVAGGHWGWPLAFALFFVAVYAPVMRREAAGMSERFHDRYGVYAAHVPLFVPRPTPYHPATAAMAPDGSEFHWSRLRRYREWEASVGVVALIAALALKALISG